MPLLALVCSPWTWSWRNTTASSLARSCLQRDDGVRLSCSRGESWLLFVGPSRRRGKLATARLSSAHRAHSGPGLVRLANRRQGDLAGASSAQPPPLLPLPRDSLSLAWRPAAILRALTRHPNWGAQARITSGAGDWQPAAPNRAPVSPGRRHCHLGDLPPARPLSQRVCV